MNKRQKKKQVKMRNKKLLKRYPFIIPRNVWTGKIPKDYDYTYTEYDCIDKGWQIGFGKLLLEDLRNALIKTNYIDKFMFMQIKEKYGSLRLYTNGVPQEIQTVLDKYEFISEYICIQCGSPHACVVDDYGWYLPLCKECWDKNNKCREKKGYRTKSWEDVAYKEYVVLPDEYKVTRYSKDGEVTTTVDISEIANKIRVKFEKRRIK